jgi:hypothetical protein
MQAAGSKGGHNHWTLDGACPDTGRRHYERLYHDDVVLSPTFYIPEQSAGDAERKLFAEMMIINGVCKQKAGFERLMRAFADASGGPRGDISQLEAAMNAIQIQGVGRETTQYIALSCQLLFGQECRESFTLSQCAVIAEKFFQNRRSLPAAQVADCHAYAAIIGASTKVRRLIEPLYMPNLMDSSRRCSQLAATVTFCRGRAGELNDRTLMA